MIELFVKLIVHIIIIPIEMVRDVISLGGAIDGRIESYTTSHMVKIGEDIKEIIND